MQNAIMMANAVDAQLSKSGGYDSSNKSGEDLSWLSAAQYPLPLQKAPMGRNMVVESPTRSVINVGSLVDRPESERPGVGPEALTRWYARTARQNLPLGWIWEGFARATTVDFVNGVRTRGQMASQMETFLGSVDGYPSEVDGIQLIGNSQVLVHASNGTTLRASGIEITMGVSPLNFSPYRVEIDFTPNRVVAGQSPIAPQSLTRRRPSIRRLTLRVMTPTLTIFLPFGYTDQGRQIQTASSEIACGRVVSEADAASIYSYLLDPNSAWTPTSVVLSCFVIPALPFTTLSSQLASNASFGLMRALPGMEHGQ